MINDLGDQPKPTQSESQPKERVIEVNEWFKPFENYDKIPYDNAQKRNPSFVRSKTRRLKLANVGNFRTRVWWSEDLVDPIDAEGERYLLALPHSEVVIDGEKVKSEQERMETVPVDINLEFEDEELIGKSIPYKVQLELPSGTIIPAEIENGHTDGPSTFHQWGSDGEKFDGILIPEVGNIIDKLSFRFVPKD